MTHDDDRADWWPVLDVSTTRDQLEIIIDEQAQVCLEALVAQLEAASDLLPLERLAMLACATPLIRAQTRQALEAGWRRLQDEAAAASVVH